MGDAAPSEAVPAALESSDAATPLPAEALNTAMSDAAPSEAAPAALELPAEATPLADEKVDGLPPPPSLRIFSGCFVALFTAFLVLQQFLTSVLGTTGFWVLVAIYGAFFAGTLVSPSVCRRLGLKASMVASAAAYATLHVVVAATHAFDHDVAETVIRDNVNPILKAERSSLLVASTLFGAAPRSLVEPARVPTLAEAHEAALLDG